MTHRLLYLVLTLFAAGILTFGVSLTEQTVQAADPPTPAQTDVMQFARGAKTWADNCARCHNMRDPKELRDDQWRSVVSHMRVRGNLTGAEARDVLAFLQGSN